MLEFQQVTKRFGSFTALNQVSIHVPKGSVYGLVGPNGAGKSTLIRCAIGAYRPTSGSITVEGSPVWESPAVKARLAHIPDEIFYYPNTTISDLARLYRQMYPTFDPDRYSQLQSLFNLPKGPIRRFSKGMQKQSAFLLTMAIRPELLILDEPVDGLDPIMRRQVWQLLLEEVAQRNLTVLVSSHNLRELEDVCDHVGILDKGQMLLERDLATLQENLVKLQFLPGPEDTLPALEILHSSQTGKLFTLIVRGNAEEVEAKAKAAKAQYLNLLPLSLEEIFIYELGGISDEIRNTIL